MEVWWGEMFNYVKSAYLTSLGILTMVQDQSERMLNLAIQQSTTWQDETKKIIDEWLGTVRKQRHENQKRLEENLQRLEDMLFKRAAGK